VLAGEDFGLRLFGDVLVVRGEHVILPAVDGVVGVGQIAELAEEVHSIVILLYT
jgi:hypothetical protein